MDSAVRERAIKAAEKYAQQGKIDAAIAEYRKLLDERPRDLTTVNTVGDLFVRKGSIAEAKRCFVAVADGYESQGANVRSVAMLKKIAKLDPSDTEIAIRVAQRLADQNLVGEASHHYALAAEAFRLKGRPRDALRVLKRAADLDGTNTKARLALAAEYAKEGMSGEASEAYRHAAGEHFKKGATDEGVEALRRSLELKPDSRPALKALAEAYAARGDVQPALDLVARALEIDPNDIDLIIILGRTFRNAGMLEKAEATFNRLFRLDKSRYEYLLDVGTGYVDRGDYNLAMAIIDRCIDVMLVRRHKKKATALLKMILERDPENVFALKRLAAIYETVRERRNLVATLNSLVQAALRQDLRAEAIVALKQLVEMDPGKASYQLQLDSLGDETAPTKEEVELAAAFDSYGDYSTELLEEMVAQHPEFLIARLKLLEDLVAQQPAYLEGRLKLKQLYIDDGQNVKAAVQCLDIARLYDSRGESRLARRHLREAFAFNPDLKGPGGRGGSAPLDTSQIAGYSAALAEAAAPAQPSRAQAQTFVEYGKTLDMEWRRASRAKKPLSCVMLSIDRFGSFEAGEGGDRAGRVLEQVADSIEEHLKLRGSVLATNGGAEFLALLPETHPGAAAVVAEAMRNGVVELGILHPYGTPLTASVGVATALPYRVDTPASIAEAIAHAVDDARHAGGNRVVTAPLIGG